MRTLLVARLTVEQVTALSVPTIAAACRALRDEDIDLLVVDVDGQGAPVAAIDLLRRQAGPAHLLTIGSAPRGDERVRWLDAGADDVLTKPISPGELVARVRGVVRRLERAARQHITHGWLDIDLGPRRVTAHGRPVDLAAKEFDLLVHLASRPGLVISREDLLRAVWQSSPEWQQARTVTEHVRRLRNKIDPAGELLVSVRRIGYRFDPPAAPVDDEGRHLGTLVHIGRRIVEVEGDIPTAEAGGVDPSSFVGADLLEVVPTTWRSHIGRTAEGRDEAPTRTYILPDGDPEVVVTAVSERVEWRGGTARAVQFTTGGDGAQRAARTATAALAELPEAAVVTDPSGVVVRVNQAAERLLGIAEAETRGLAAADLLAWASPPLAGLSHGDGRLRWGASVDHVTPGGTALHLSVSAADIRDDDDVLLGAMVLLRPLSASVTDPDGWPASRPAHAGVERGDYEVRYAPIVDLERHVVVGVEAAMWWHHPDQGPRPVGAVGSGEPFWPIGPSLVLEAGRQVARWHRAGHDLRLAVRLAAERLDDPTLAGRCRQAFDETGVSPAQVVLAVSDTSLAEDLDERRLQALRDVAATGVRLAVADFGTGWASLARLRGLPVDELEIGPALIARVDTSGTAAATVRAVVDIADELGMRAVARGVVDVAQERTLLRLGCCQASGPLYGTGVPAADIKLLRL